MVRGQVSARRMLAAVCHNLLCPTRARPARTAPLGPAARRQPAAIMAGLSRTAISPQRRVLLDARPLQGAHAQRGIGSYVRGLITGLREAGFDARTALLFDAG